MEQRLIPSITLVPSTAPAEDLLPPARGASPLPGPSFAEVQFAASYEENAEELLLDMAEHDLWWLVDQSTMVI